MIQNLLFFFVAGSIVAGCTGQTTEPVSTAPDRAPVVVVDPSDGAQQVSPDTKIRLVFNQGVDRSLTERGFHLISGASPSDTTCADSLFMEHGNMALAMMNAQMMRHYDDYHSTAGSFEWDNASRVCTFAPDSQLIPMTEYMIHFDDAMTSMIDGMMGDQVGMEGMGGMGGHGFQTTPAGIVMHFQTGTR